MSISVALNKVLFACLIFCYNFCFHTMLVESTWQNQVLYADIRDQSFLSLNSLQMSKIARSWWRETGSLFFFWKKKLSLKRLFGELLFNLSSGEKSNSSLPLLVVGTRYPSPYKGWEDNNLKMYVYNDIIGDGGWGNFNHKDNINWKIRNRYSKVKTWVQNIKSTFSHIFP